MHIGQTVAHGARGVPRVQEQGQQLVSEEEDDDGDQQGEYRHHQQTGLQALLDPLVLACTDVLGREAGHGVGDVHVGQHGQGVDLRGSSVSGHQHFAEGVDQTLHHHHGEGHQRLLEHGGQADLGDTLHRHHVEEGQLHALFFRLAGHPPHPAEQHQQGGHGAEALGDQRGPRHASHAHAEADNEQQVQHDVCQAGDHQEDQGRLAVPLGVIDAVESVVEEQEDRAAEIDLQIRPGVGHDIRVRAQQLQQGTGQQRSQAHDEEPQDAQRDDGGGDGGLHLMDAPGTEQLGHHHRTAHGQPGGHGHRQKHDGEGGAHGRHCVFAHKFSHHRGVHHIVELLEQIARHHGQGKEKQQIQRSALRQILNHVHFPLLDKIRSHSPQCGSETPRSGRAPQG